MAGTKCEVFFGRSTTIDVIVKDIENYVRAKAYKWQVNRTYSNWLVCRRWGISERVLV